MIENGDEADKYLAEEDRLIYEDSVAEISSLPELDAKLTELQQAVLQKTKAGENID